MNAIGLVNAERIKLASTKSPWWCLAVAVAAGVGFPLLIFSTIPRDSVGDLPIGSTLAGCAIALPVLWIMAILAVTTEYRFSTIRTAFSITPKRAPVVLAKTLLLTVGNAIIGTLLGLVAFALAKGLRSNLPFALSDNEVQRQVLGVGLVAGGGTLLAVGLGFLLRQSAGALAGLLVWFLVLEPMTLLIPKVGDDIYSWMPFARAGRFSECLLQFAPPPDSAPGPWGSLAYFLAVAFAVFLAALLVTQRRDA